MAKKSTKGKNSGKKAEKASAEKEAATKESEKKDPNQASIEEPSEKQTSKEKNSNKKSAAKKSQDKTGNENSSKKNEEELDPSEEKKNYVTSKINFRATPGKILILRLFVKNRQLIPMLVRLSVDDWVSGDGKIYATHSRIEPGYLYILQEGEAAATISLLVPHDIEEGQTLRSNLRFPGANELPLPIMVNVTSAKEEVNNSPEEKSFNISLPFEKVREENVETQNEERVSVAVYQLVSGLSNLSALPSQWLFAEGMVLICMEGERLLKEKEGIEFFSNISRTRFYKNLTLAFTTARLPQWISGSIISSSSLHTAMGGQFGQGRIIYIWLKWLFGMADTDIEHDDLKRNFSDLPQINLEEAVARYSGESQLWAGYLLLGLSRISPKIKALLKNISDNVPKEEGKQKENFKNVEDILNEIGPLTR